MKELVDMKDQGYVTWPLSTVHILLFSEYLGRITRDSWIFCKWLPSLDAIWDFMQHDPSCL